MRKPRRTSQPDWSTTWLIPRIPMSRNGTFFLLIELYPNSRGRRIYFSRKQKSSTSHLIMSYVTISDSLRKLILYQAGSTKRCHFTIHSDHISVLTHRPPSLDDECELPTITECVSTENPVVLYERSIPGSERLSLKLRGSSRFYCMLVIYAGNTAFDPADFSSCE
jgi:hypothetical protein